MIKRSFGFMTMSGLLLVGAAALAEPNPTGASCPTAVKTSIARAFPKSTITTCKLEHEHGHDQFEVKLTKEGGDAVEVDVSPDGKILQVEEKVALDKVPAAVTKAFAAKYPKAKIESAEKQTASQGSVTYELAFTIEGARKEATFAEDGKFLEAE